jgi:hypothetical protein
MDKYTLRSRPFYSVICIFQPYLNNNFDLNYLKICSRYIHTSSTFSLYNMILSYVQSIHGSLVKVREQRADFKIQSQLTADFELS